MFNNIKFITFLLISLLYVSTAIAKCDFGIKLGDKYPERFVENTGFSETIKEEGVTVQNLYKQNNGLVFAYYDANEVCKTTSLKDIEIEYTFLYGELASIRMIAVNDEKNIPSKKLTLMKYAKSNYGDFDTGFDDQNYNDFTYWEKNKTLVIYNRTLNNNNIWDEEIYITNEKYEDPLNMALSGELYINEID
tara:strand:+ start:1559 stop:2134 length:576 start_codon:yes stop_codon:yes gene_type:complete